MRIVGGEYKRTQLVSPKNSATHPMGDRVREAVFDMLGDVGGMTVVDLYAGSGALGLESISRGAKSAVLVDADSEACRAIGKNVATLHASHRCKVHCKQVSDWLKSNDRTVHDLIFVDPPYDQFDWQRALDAGDALVDRGLLVISHPPYRKKDLPELKGLELLRQRKYGGAMISIFRKTG